LKEFVKSGLQNYGKLRNHPERHRTGRLSPYLHLGNLGPTYDLAGGRRGFEEGKGEEAREAFVDELIDCRKLAINFVKLTPNYDSWECTEPWAKKTLLEHTQDRREHVYSLEQLEHFRFRCIQTNKLNVAFPLRKATLRDSLPYPLKAKML